MRGPNWLPSRASDAQQGERMSESVAVPMRILPGAFNMFCGNFVVTGPTPDGMLQLAFCEDFVVFDQMMIEPDPAGGPGAARFAFPNGAAERVVLGRVKFSVQAADQLIALLQEYSAKAKQAVETLQG